MVQKTNISIRKQAKIVVRKDTVTALKAKNRIPKMAHQQMNYLPLTRL